MDTFATAKLDGKETIVTCRIHAPALTVAFTKHAIPNPTRSNAIVRLAGKDLIVPRNAIQL